MRVRSSFDAACDDGVVIGMAAKLPRCVVAMEACCNAHLFGRRLSEQELAIR